VGTGAALALVVQNLLAARLGLPVQRLLPLSLIACLLGVLGAKCYYLATHRSERLRHVADAHDRRLPFAARAIPPI
jgi:phosphatidylglycerol:prolipoprotein diacylglycerol transferase